MTLEEYLHFKGYTTKKTSYHKIKANTGISKAFVDLFFNNLKNGVELHTGGQMPTVL